MGKTADTENLSIQRRIVWPWKIDARENMMTKLIYRKAEKRLHSQLGNVDIG